MREVRGAVPVAAGLAPGLRVLVAHDWMLGWWGSERVVEQILRVFPDADLVTAFVDEAVQRHHLRDVRLRKLWLGRLPGFKRWYQYALPLEAAAFARVSTQEYDVVISSSHALAKAVAPGRRGLHICYCYSPPRYLYDQFDHYHDRSSLLRRTALRWSRWPLQRLDKATAKRVSHFVTLSHFVGRRVQAAYNRKARVVYPPVAPKVDATGGTSVHREDFLLYLGRLVPYKRVDVIVAAARRLGVRVVIAGDGPERSRLEAMAPANVDFVGAVSDEEAAALMESCMAFVFCAEEDFGIAPVEANAHGAPVIALRAGGIVESMREGETAVLFDRADADGLCEAVQRATRRRWDESLIRANAARFSPAQFREAFRRTVSDALEGTRW
jgi:glycosyltransferase involved in cell wall biosynthesis